MIECPVCRVKAANVEEVNGGQWYALLCMNQDCHAYGDSVIYSSPACDELGCTRLDSASCGCLHIYECVSPRSQYLNQSEQQA